MQPPGGRVAQGVFKDVLQGPLDEPEIGRNQGRSSLELRVEVHPPLFRREVPDFCAMSWTSSPTGRLSRSSGS